MTAAEYKAAREARGTQEQVARALAVGRVTVARRETGVVPVTKEAELALLSLPPIWGAEDVLPVTLEHLQKHADLQRRRLDYLLRPGTVVKFPPPYQPRYKADGGGFVDRNATMSPDLEFLVVDTDRGLRLRYFGTVLI